MYRYSLTRILEHTPTRRLLFIMLNPSTATAAIDDPTIRRCIGYARRWEYGQLLIGNLFALRSTDPRNLRKVEDPIGPENDRHLVDLAFAADRIICAWGTDGGLMRRGEAVRRLLHGRFPGKPLHCLEATKFGEPKHPLYLRGDLEPKVWPIITEGISP